MYKNKNTVHRHTPKAIETFAYRTPAYFSLALPYQVYVLLSFKVALKYFYPFRIPTISSFDMVECNLERILQYESRLQLYMSFLEFKWDTTRLGKTTFNCTMDQLESA